MEKIKHITNRLPIIDILRVLLTALVVNLHIRIITAVHSNFLENYAFIAVPLFLTLSFFLMSKYFFNKNANTKSLFKRIKRLVIPLLVWSLLGFLIHPNLITPANFILQLVSGGVVNVPLYYLDLLIIFSIIFWLTTYLPPRFRQYLYSGIIIACFLVEYTGINYTFFIHTAATIRNGPGRFVELIKFASVGLLFALLLENSTQYKKYLLGIIGISLVALLFKIPQSQGFHYSGIPLFSSTVLVFSVLLLIKDVQIKEQLSKFTSVLGRYSYGVYLSHFIFLEVLFRLVPQSKYFVSDHSLLFLGVFIVLCYSVLIAINKLSFGKLSFLLE